jgi:5-methylcytosine-specific restriction enzyme subunit McrC
MTRDKESIVIKNIYYMLSYAYQNLQHNNFKEIETEYFENIHDLFAAILAIGISSQLKQGLNREYIEKQESLYTLKGKINIRESIQLKFRNINRLSCCFDELSENHYMNQILKTTSLLLIYNNNVKRDNKDMLKKALLFFSEVDKLEPSAINWQKLNYNRNNASYRMMMNICYLVLNELLLTTIEGKQRLASFLDDQLMSKLYEKFLLEYYKKHYPQYHPASKEIKWDTTGIIDFLPNMRSDTMLFDGEKKLIIDAKYYGKIMQTYYDVDTIRSNNLYQIFTYVKNEDKNNTGLVSGMLLYAKSDEDIIPAITYDLSGNQISVKTLDLNKDFSIIKKQLNSIINEWVLL